jgi:PAS domain S-box-containing protein
MMVICSIAIFALLLGTLIKLVNNDLLFWMNSMVLLIQISLFWLIRRGYPRISAVILVAGIWLTLTTESLLFHGLTSPSYAVFFITIMISGLILGGRAAIVMSIISVLTNFLILGVYTTRNQPVQLYQQDMLELAISYSIGWIIFALMMVVADQNIRMSIGKRRADKQKLKTRDIELQAAASAADEALMLQARMVEIVESSSDFVGIVNPDRQVTYVNRTGRRMIGLSPDDKTAISPNTADYHPAWAMAIIENEGVPTALRNGIWHGETALLTRDGREIPVAQTITPHYRPDGTLDSMSSVMKDITELKRGERERLELALQNERMDVIRDLVDTLAHDLKTPLTILQTSIDLLERLSDPERQKQKLEIVRQQTGAINDYIQDMLTISRLEYTPQHTMVYMDLRHLLETVAQKLSPKMEVKRIVLRYEFPPELPRVYADEDGLLRVFTNLVENAVNYTPQDGMIALRLREAEHGVLADVVDNGIGIAPEDQARIFERFFRAYNGKQFHRGGTGLGLAIVQKIVQQHGGKVEVQSKPGAGSTFRVWLPIATPEKPPSNPS